MLDECVKLLPDLLPHFGRIDVVNGSTKSIPTSDLAYVRVVGIPAHVLKAVQVELLTVETQVHLAVNAIGSYLKNQVPYAAPKTVCECG
jgi:hypothetical protein